MYRDAVVPGQKGACGCWTPASAPLGRPAGLGPDRPLCSCEQGRCVAQGPPCCPAPRGPLCPSPRSPLLCALPWSRAGPTHAAPGSRGDQWDPPFDLRPLLLEGPRGCWVRLSGAAAPAGKLCAGPRSLTRRVHVCPGGQCGQHGRAERVGPRFPSAPPPLSVGGVVPWMLWAEPPAPVLSCRVFSLWPRSVCSAAV